MIRPKVVKSGGRDVPIEDPTILRASFRILRDTRAEFPIKVEGTSTLPYTSVVKALALEAGTCTLKLVRPLPHELLQGAEFRMIFTVEDQRYEALIVYQGREEYLTYKFTLPPFLLHADRRTHKRFPFRPRESAYVTAQDGGIPGLGVAGPLVNISEGGVALRVDRVLRLEDGIRIPPSSALFDRGKGFARIRIQDLPRLPILEVSGRVAHTLERGSEVILGLSFQDLDEAHATLLRDSLAFREKMYRSSGVREGAPREGSAPRSGVPSASRPAPRAADAIEPIEPIEPTPERSDALLQLARRMTRLAVVVGPEGRDRLLAFLRDAGYHRLELVGSLQEAGGLWRRPGEPPPALVLADLALRTEEPLAAVRAMEQEIRAFGDIPTLILCDQVDPTLHLALAHRTRILPLVPEDPQEAQEWLDTLERMAGLREF
jgi:hypothetical protein